MFKSFAALALAGAASAIDVRTFDFMQYIAKHGKQYSSIEEFTLRLSLWSEVDQTIKEWNADPSVTSWMGHNFLSDYTFEEKAALRGLAPEGESHHDEEFTAIDHHVGAYATFDWRNQGQVVPPVRDQGACGSCWAFSATGTVEMSVAIANNTAAGNYSEQQLVSCSQSYGNNGCNGGWYYWAWDYMKGHAQETEADYPYTSGARGVTGTCHADLSLGVVTVPSYVKIGQTNTDIVNAINIKPVSVALDAARAVFQQYTSGVVTSGCGTMLDHAVIAIGYGTENGQDYFLVRNSWGSSWGDQGYIKIGMSSTGSAPGYCGINKAVYYPNTA